MSGRELEAGLLPDPTGSDSDDPFAVDLGLDAGAPEDQALIERFLHLFGGRRDLYAEQYLRRGRGVYRPVRQTLTVDVARDHLDGTRTLGQYVLFPDQSCSFGVIDLDLSRDAMTWLERQAGDKPSPVAHPALRDYLQRLLRASKAMGLRLYAFDSGRRGAHLWLLLSQRRQARLLRQTLNAVVQSAGLPSADVDVEIFPKQSQAGPKGLSSLVKLPLGVHRMTMRRAALLDANFQAISDLKQALQDIEQTPVERVEAVAGRNLVAFRPLPSPELQALSDRDEALAPTARPHHIGLSLEAIAPGKAEKVAVESILARCSVLERIVDKAHRQGQLLPEEARAVTYTLGVISEAEQASLVLRAACLSAKGLQQARKGHPQPMGCRKLARLSTAPGLCRNCELNLQRPEWAPYASPTLFALDGKKPLPPKAAPKAFAAPIFQDPLASIGERLRNIEEQLKKIPAQPVDVSAVDGDKS